MQTDPHLRAITVHADVGKIAFGLDSGADRVIGRGEDGHHTVAHALDHLTAAVGDRRLDGLGYPAQQFEGRLITS